MRDQTVLLTGATGFVGRYTYAALAAAGYRIRCATRNVEAAQRHFPERDWVHLDLHAQHTLDPSLYGCDSAFYLIHGLDEGPGYSEREGQGAEAFHQAAVRAGIKRIVYLGAVTPAGEASPHLRSRLEVGEILRQPGVSTVELRAGMIIGHGSGSWQIVRDLARRLPLMVLPRWLKNHSQPVSIEDVVASLLFSLQLPGAEARALDVPGPEALTHRRLIAKVRNAFGYRARMIDVPVLTPRLSCYWIYFFTRAKRAMARELVEGLTSDLLAPDAGIFELFPEYTRVSLDDAILRALRDERVNEWPSTEAARRVAEIAQVSGEAQ